MSDTPTPDLQAKASDPNTPATELQQLATNPALRPLIAKNPTAYTGLLDWMAAKNEPEVMTALREREQMFQSGMAIQMPSDSLRPHVEEPPQKEPPLGEPTSEFAAAQAPENPETSESNDSQPDSKSSNPASSDSEPPVPESPNSEPSAPETSDSAPSGSESPNPEPSAPESSPAPDASLETPLENEASEPDAQTTPAVPPNPAESSAPQRTSIFPENTLPAASTPPADATTLLPPVPAMPPAPVGEATPSANVPTVGFQPAEFPPQSYPPQGYAPNPNTPLAGAMPVATPPAPQKEQSNTLLWVIFGVLLVLVVGLSVALMLAFLGRATNDSENNPQPQASTSAEANPKENAEPEETSPAPAEKKPEPQQTEREVVAPAPDGAYNATSFTTKTGNTTCSITAGIVICAVKDHEAQIGPCDSSTSAVASIEDGEAEVSCQIKDIYTPSGNVLEYGESIASGDFACTSDHDFTSCWNIYTGKGFQIARQMYRDFQVD